MVSENYTDKLFACQSFIKILTDKQNACQAYQKVKKTHALTSRKLVKNQINWMELVEAVYFFHSLTSKKLVSACKIISKTGKNIYNSFTDKQKACQCNDCRRFFSCADKLFACQWIKNTSLTSKKLVSSRKKQKAKGKRLLERWPLDLREHLNGDIA